MSLKDCLNTLNGLGVEMKRVRIIGGGAKGMLWRQIVADILGLELQKVKVDDSSFGTAMLTAVGIGWFDSFAHAAETCVEIDSVSKPDPATHELYEKLFLKYKAVHDALAPIYRGVSHDKGNTNSGQLRRAGLRRRVRRNFRRAGGGKDGETGDFCWKSSTFWAVWGRRGLVTIYLPLCDGVGHQVSFGLAEELLRLSISMGAEDEYPANWLDSADPAGGRKRITLPCAL